jgi:hypothetical protein
LDDKDKEKLQKVLERDPLSLIEYWSIDPDYDGVTSAQRGRTIGRMWITTTTRCIVSIKLASVCSIRCRERFVSRQLMCLVLKVKWWKSS